MTSASAIPLRLNALDCVRQLFNKIFFSAWAIPPFFSVYCRMRFMILGRSVGKGKKNKNKIIGKGVWSWDARYHSIISVKPVNNKVWLQSQHRGNGGRKKSMSLLKSNENWEKTKNLQGKNLIMFRF